MLIILRWVGWEGHVIRVWEIRDAYRLLVGKPEGKQVKKANNPCTGLGRP
jgi:hypothetical protein